MKLNRRSVLGAIGLVGVGTGAAFGSGAFTSTTANREVEVNILGGADYESGSGVIEDADNTAESNIATEITETVGIDVLVDITSSAVSVESRSGSISGVDTLFPQSDVYDNLTTAYVQGTTNYVSLVANDVRIVFGGDGDNEGLPANSTVDFDELFAFGRTNSTAGPNVTFETGSPSDSSILTDLDNGSGTSGDPSSGSVPFTGPTSGDTLDADISTGTVDDATEPLNITIESPN